MHCSCLLPTGEPATELCPMFKVQLSARAAFFFMLNQTKPPLSIKLKNSFQTLKFHTVVPVLDGVFWKFMLEKILTISAWVLFLMFCSFQWSKSSCLSTIFFPNTFLAMQWSLVNLTDPIGVYCANISPRWRVRKSLLCLRIRVNSLVNQKWFTSVTNVTGTCTAWVLCKHHLPQWVVFCCI